MRVITLDNGSRLAFYSKYNYILFPSWKKEEFEVFCDLVRKIPQDMLPVLRDLHECLSVEGLIAFLSKWHSSEDSKRTIEWVAATMSHPKLPRQSVYGSNIGRWLTCIPHHLRKIFDSMSKFTYDTKHKSIVLHCDREDFQFETPIALAKFLILMRKINRYVEDGYYGSGVTLSYDTYVPFIHPDDFAEGIAFEEFKKDLHESMGHLLIV